jgi:cytochrome c biogenesis protein CcmG/thiol:disulfide interchange protein DsbE
MNRILILLPILTLLYLGYLSYENGKPPELPALIDAPMPKFEFENIDINSFNGYGDKAFFSHNDLPKRTVLINAFATWCSTCIIEHDELIELSQVHGIPVYGIAFRDKREAIVRTLNKIGNPYALIGNDPEGAELVKWRLYATPETWIIDKNGRIRYHHLGYITKTDIKYIFLPLIKKIEAEG